MGGGESNLHDCGPPASFSVHLASSAVTKGNSGDGCDLASTLYKYDLRKGDLFVLSWARVRRMRRGKFFLALECFKYVCVLDVMDVVFSVCIVKRGAVGARVWRV